MTQQCETDRQSRENTTLQERRLEIRPMHTEERNTAAIPHRGNTLLALFRGKGGERDYMVQRRMCCRKHHMHVNLGGRLIHSLG